LARLGIEPRLPEYILGALPLSYLAMGGSTWVVTVVSLGGISDMSRLHLKQGHVYEVLSDIELRK
jgi:hypothetical protein